MAVALPSEGAKIPFITKLFFGAGGAAGATKEIVFNTFLLFYFTQVMGLSGTLAGTAIFIALCFDAVTDPLVGSISDNFRSRWGRRHPFMYLAILPMPLAFYWLFNSPEGLSEHQLFAWMTFFSVLVRVSMTFYAIPHAAMTAELTSDFNERTSLLSYAYFFGAMGAVIILFLAYAMYFAPSEDFADGRLNPFAYADFSLLCAVIIGLAILTTSVGTHNQIPRLLGRDTAKPFSFSRFYREIRQVLSNRSYRMLVFALLFASTAKGFNDIMGLYMNTYFWEFTTQQLSIMVVALVISTVIAVGVTGPISQRFDKKNTLLVVAILVILGGPVLVILRLMGWMVPNGHPWLLPLFVGHGVIIITLVISMSILLASMLADTVDQSEVATGERQEGLFASAISFTTKATSGVGGLLAGITLDLVEFPSQAAPGTVDIDTIYNLGLIVGPGLMLLYAGIPFFAARYDITREHFTEIQVELTARRRCRTQAETAD
jgi:GPH family glycoside/pentoside/hexuronide:cation symporter